MSIPSISSSLTSWSLFSALQSFHYPPSLPSSLATQPHEVRSQYGASLSLLLGRLVLFLDPSSDVQAPGDGCQEGAEHVSGVDAVESEGGTERNEKEAGE